MVEGGMTCIKYILAVFSFVFVIFGILLIVFGVQSLTAAEDFKKVLDSPDRLAIFCIVVGALLFIIAFLGCCGALKENQCMLITFSIILIIVLVIELILGGLGVAFNKEVREVIDERFNSTLSKYNFDNPNDTVTVMFDEVQSKMKCCGIRNYTDWTDAFPRRGDDLPNSCCPLPTPENPKVDHSGSAEKCTTESKDLFREGCLEKIVASAKNIYGPVALIAITVAVLQLLGIIFACCLTYAVKKEYQVV